jgi:hypothetical protein
VSIELQQKPSVADLCGITFKEEIMTGPKEKDTLDVTAE